MPTLAKLHVFVDCALIAPAAAVGTYARCQHARSSPPKCLGGFSCTRSRTGADHTYLHQAGMHWSRLGTNPLSLRCSRTPAALLHRSHFYGKDLAAHVPCEGAHACMHVLVHFQPFNAFNASRASLQCAPLLDCSAPPCCLQSKASCACTCGACMHGRAHVSIVRAPSVSRRKLEWAQHAERRARAWRALRCGACMCEQGKEREGREGSARKRAAHVQAVEACAQMADALLLCCDCPTSNCS